MPINLPLARQHIAQAERGAWNDAGALKTKLRDDAVSQRNRFARQAMKAIEERQGDQP